VGAVTSPGKGALVPTSPQAVTGDEQPYCRGDIHHYGARERLSRAPYRLRQALSVVGWHSWGSGEEHLGTKGRKQRGHGWGGTNTGK